MLPQAIARRLKEDRGPIAEGFPDVTVLFADLRGFTAFAESRSVDEVISALNRYLSLLTDAILDNGGTLVSYIGDGVLAAFGAPIPCEDHADRALRAARAIVASGRTARPTGASTRASC